MSDALDYDVEGAERLAEAVVMRACLDYVAIRHPQMFASYLKAWQWETGGDYPARVADDWLARVRAELATLLNVELAELAVLVGKRHWIDIVQKRKCECKHSYQHYLGRVRFSRADTRGSKRKAQPQGWRHDRFDSAFPSQVSQPASP